MIWHLETVTGSNMTYYIPNEFINAVHLTSRTLKANEEIKWFINLNSHGVLHTPNFIYEWTELLYRQTCISKKGKWWIWLTELRLVISLSFRISKSILTVEEHFASPAARQSAAIHWAIENKACFATPPDCTFTLKISESSKESKLLFPEFTNPIKKFWRACNVYNKFMLKMRWKYLTNYYFHQTYQ